MNYLKYFLACLLVLLASCATHPQATTSSEDNEADRLSQQPSYLPFSDVMDKSIRYPESADIFLFARHAPVAVIKENIYDEIKIPQRVRYQYASKEAIDRAVRQLEAFLNSDHDAPILFDKIAYCGPYLTEYFSKNSFFAALPQKQILKPTSMGGRRVIIKECALSDEQGGKAMANFLRNTLAAESRVTIRKLTETELDWYWSIIAYDIDEPIFMVENSRAKFLLHFSGDIVFYFDNLTTLRWKE